MQVAGDIHRAGRRRQAGGCAVSAGAASGASSGRRAGQHEAGEPVAGHHMRRAMARHWAVLADRWHAARADDPVRQLDGHAGSVGFGIAGDEGVLPRARASPTAGVTGGAGGGHAPVPVVMVGVMLIARRKLLKVGECRTASVMAACRSASAAGLVAWLCTSTWS